MKNTYLFTGLFAVMILFSCKKGNDASPSGASLPKTYTEDLHSVAISNLTTYNLSYDAKNRLISMVSIPEPSILKFVYQYPTDKTVIMDMYNYGDLSIHENFWLNSFSFLDSTLQYDDSNDTTTEKYYYDGNHLLTEVNTYDYVGSAPELSNQTQYTYDNNGDPVTQADYSGTTSFTYYSNLPYTLLVGQPYVQTPKYFIKTTSATANGIPSTATHYYLFDGNNRLTKDSAYISGINAVLVKTYTY